MNNDDQSDRERPARKYTGAAAGYAELWSPLIRPVGRRLLEALPWNGARGVLDVGTGTGALIPDICRLAPAARTIAVDCSFGMLALATGAGASLAMMDAMQLGLRTGAFDVAVMTFVLFHMPEPIAALAEVRRVVWGAWDPSPMPPRRHELMNTPEKVTGLLTAAAFVPAGHEHQPGAAPGPAQTRVSS